LKGLRDRALAEPFFFYIFFIIFLVLILLTVISMLLPFAAGDRHHPPGNGVESPSAAVDVRPWDVAALLPCSTEPRQQQLLPGY
jgi:hypothetical protein